MPFQVRPLRELLVRPVLPEPIIRLSELANNLLWSWDHNFRALFRRLDPALWRACQRNPVLFLGQLPQASLERAAADPRYLGLYRHCVERYDSYMQAAHSLPSDRLIAYFSMEYGLAECLPIYSGGLGVLSGDHLKAASDALVPLVAVGLMYQQGYFQQSLNPDGWQQERYSLNDFYTLPIQPALDGDKELRVSVKLPSGPVQIKVWRMNVGRVQLFLLDTNIDENTNPENRDITDRLYPGDHPTRIRQEFVLGIGGLRALKAMGLDPTVFHMNEGHSAFLSLERIRSLMQEQGLSFDEALGASRTNNVFTTHTSVPAGIDLFDPGLMHQYFEEFSRDLGVPFDRLMGLGRGNPSDHSERFSMAILAFKTSAYRNAVSRLHRSVSQAMWQGLWPQLPTWEVPVTSITNGVHLPTWINGDLASLYDAYLQPDWRERYPDPMTWELMDEIPDTELWEVRRQRKRALIGFVRERAKACAKARNASASELRRASEVLDPDALTIGFARRFATYKRATLIFRDVERLKRLLTNPTRPVQMVIAGKAHPLDEPGKILIREIVQFSRDPEVTRRVVFVEDYGVEVARELVQGVDVWLNNPCRGEEACGTSGMKAGINGVLNLSILDGWFDEAYEVSGGWAIGERIAYSPDQDEVHARAIYSLLENEIVPLYYSRREDGVPNEWVQRVRQSVRALCPQFNCQRMVEEYMGQLYAPAHEAFTQMRKDSFSRARELTRWNAGVQQLWDRVRFVDAGPLSVEPVHSGRSVTVTALLDLAGLTPRDVRVEAVFGRIGVNGDLEDTEVLTLAPSGNRGANYSFSGGFAPRQTGRLGYALRVCPDHYHDPLTRPCGTLIKWASGA
jgi:starch phosphorylase